MEEQQNVLLNPEDLTQNEQIPEQPQVIADEYFGKPEKYDYSEVELPENYHYDEDMLSEFNELASKFNLSQKSANELMTMAIKLTKMTDENINNNLAEQHAQKVMNNQNALINDREIGGARLGTALNIANIAFDHFAGEEAHQLLHEAGLDVHPSIVKLFYKIGKLMVNDEFYGVNSPAIKKENREDILFPTM